ncbi:MAG: hypothetical protein LRY26_00650 [Bacilli bacterium]|nr:hypothetical protein [Bacilli bacterium]
MDYTAIDNFIYKYFNDPFVLYAIIAILFMLLIALILMMIRSMGKKNKKIEPIVIERVKSEDTIDLESLVEKMQEDLETEDKEIAVFESDQEEKAIISLTELMAMAKEEEKETKFQNTQFISPIYGVEKEEKLMPKHEAKPVETIKTNRRS